MYKKKGGNVYSVCVQKTLKKREAVGQKNKSETIVGEIG